MRRRGRRILKWVAVGTLAMLGLVIVVGRMAGFGCAGASRFGFAGLLSQADLLEGDWVGTWASSQSPMAGALRCRVKKLERGVYEAHFDAVFAKVLSNQSTVRLKVEQKGKRWAFTGKEDLGLLKGGVYQYDGSTDGEEFICNYDSSYDKGTFTLRRQLTPTKPSGGSGR